MIVVFWLEQDPMAPTAPPSARHEPFGAEQLSAALKFAEGLRARRASGEPISHVAIQSELPQSVGLPGVADPAADYAHYKRRLDPAIQLGRARPSPGESSTSGSR